MERENNYTKSGRINDFETLIWLEKSSLLCSLVHIFTYFIPVILIVAYYSFRIFGVFGWVFVGEVLFLYLLFCIILLIYNIKWKESYAFTSEKMILIKRTKKLRFWFDYSEVLNATVRRSLADIIFKRGTVKLTVIYTYRSLYTNEIVKRKVGSIYMRHIKDYKLIVNNLIFIKRNYYIKNLKSLKDLFIQLTFSFDRVKYHSAKDIHNLLFNLDHTRLIKADKVFRENSSYAWRKKVDGISIERFIHADLSIEEKIAVIGLSSFHSNGYFRMKAIKKFSEFDNPVVIPFLLIRLNDWVSEVQEYAIKTLQNYINEKYCNELVYYLPLILRLKNNSKDKAKTIIYSILSLITSTEEGVKSLFKGLISRYNDLRLSCYKLLMQYKVIEHEDLIKYIMIDKNPIIRMYVLKEIYNQLSLNDFINLTDLFLDDKNASIRKFILEANIKYSLDDTRIRLEKSIYDENRNIRELARFYLKDRFNFSEIYRKGIYKSEVIYGSICGLGETGNSDDADILEKFLDSKEIKIVKAALYSISKLDFDSFNVVGLSFLNDPRRGLSKLAKRLLIGKLSDNDADIIYNIYKETKYEHVKIYCCQILFNMSKWESLYYILEFIDSKIEAISNLCEVALEKWILKSNRNYTIPTPNQLAKVKISFKKNEDFIKDHQKNNISFNLRAYD